MCASVLLTSVSNTHRDMTYPSSVTDRLICDTGKRRACRARALFFRLLFCATHRRRGGMHEWGMGICEFYDDKTPSIRYIFFFPERTRIARATTREVTVIGCVRSLCPSYVHEMPLYTSMYDDTHVCPLLVRSFYAGTDRVARAFAAEMEMEFRLDFMRQ